MSKIPVLVLAFNRADHVKKAMNAIRVYQPERLYLECDGPRMKKQGEKQAVEETRKAMLNMVDWPCEVKTLFREENLGCAKAVYGAISWFFEQEEYGIICEDDIVFSQDYFKLCEDLLLRYANEDRIMEIASVNHTNRKDIPNTYVYSLREHCWGWATWRRAWKKMDMSMAAVPTLKTSFYTSRLGLFEGLMLKKTLSAAFENLDSFSSWAYRWSLSILVNDGLVIVPGSNLSINIGVDGGEHYGTGDRDPYANLKLGSIEWPLVYNDSFEVDKIQDKLDRADFIKQRRVGLYNRIVRTFKN